MQFTYLKSESISKTFEEPNFRMNYDQIESLLKSETQLPGIFGDTTTMSIPEYIENIRNILRIRKDDLAELFDVSYQTILKWMSGASLPDVESQKLIVQLSKISDQFEESNVSRPDLLIDAKAFHGKSLMDLVRSGEANDKHVESLVEEDRIRNQAYQKFRLANSESTPSDSWKSYISIPGTIGNY